MEFVYNPLSKIVEQNFVEKIYRNIQTFALQVLQQYNSWASRNGAVSIFYLTSTRNMFVGKLLKRARCLVFLRSIFFTIMSDSRLIKSVRFFEQIYILKWVIFFASFCWLWDSLLENLKLKEKLQIWDFESFIFWPKFRLFGAVLRHFSECNFQIFHLHRTMVADIFTHLSHHKKASYGPEYHSFTFKLILIYMQIRMLFHFG